MSETDARGQSVASVLIQQAINRYEVIKIQKKRSNISEEMPHLREREQWQDTIGGNLTNGNISHDKAQYHLKPCIAEHVEYWNVMVHIAPRRGRNGHEQ